MLRGISHFCVAHPLAPGPGLDLRLDRLSMHRLFALPRFPDEAQTDPRRAYVAAWILLLTALLVGPVAAFLKPGDAVPWLLTTAAVADTSFLMIAIIRCDSLRRSRREEV